MDRTDRAGHDALTKLFARFTGSQVDPGWLADQLLTRYIIGADTQDYAGNPYHSKAERLRRVLREVMGNGREGVFQDLVDILLENETYAWLGRELKGAYTDAGGTWTGNGGEVKVKSDDAVQQQQTEPTLKELLSLVQTTNFFGLGLQLNIKEYDLNVIEKDHRGDVRMQMRVMFQQYLRQTVNPSWQEVATALNTIGEDKIADTIAKKYGVTVEPLSD